jgi:hypothetical protein
MKLIKVYMNDITVIYEIFLPSGSPVPVGESVKMHV